MTENSRRKKAALMLLIKILSVIAVAAVMLGLLLFVGTFIVARGPYREAAQRLCATMAEKNRNFAGVFFTTDEINSALSYTAPEETDTVADNFGTDTSTGALREEISGDGWKGVIIRTSGASSAVLSKGSTVSCTAAIGLEGTVDAVFYDGCLTYAGFGGEDKYSVVCCDKDGKLHIGAKNIYEITRSGYEWGITADRVLVRGGIPQTGLGGGYGSKAAIGQTAEGDYVIFYAVGTGFFSSGITYDETAAVMYEYGAVNAASLVIGGGFRENGSLTMGGIMTGDYTLLITGGEEAAE